MSYCPKCGEKVSEEMSFCPKCGAPVKIEQADAETPRARRDRGEKAEKSEKEEKRGQPEKTEKGEKHEKRQFGFMGPLIGGLILIFLGLTSYFAVTGLIDQRILWAFFFVIIGVLIIVGVIVGSVMASRRHPRP